MNKFILLIALSWVVLSVWADETAKESYMPQNLYTTTLPEDYPQEIDELFQYYAEFRRLFIEKETSYTVNSVSETTREIWADFIEKRSSEEILKLQYLKWLAINTIPEYYYEFLRLNGLKNIWYNDDIIDKHSFIPTRLRKRFCNFPSKSIGYYSLSANNVFGFFDGYTKSNHIFDDTFYAFKDKIVVKGNILNVEEYSVEGKYYSGFFLIELNIVDALGDMFKEKIIIVEIKSGDNSQELRLRNDLKIDGTIVLPIHWMRSSELRAMVKFKGDDIDLNYIYMCHPNSVWRSDSDFFGNKGEGLSEKPLVYANSYEELKKKFNDGLQKRISFINNAELIE